MGIKEFLKNRLSKTERFKEAEEERKINRLLDEREKSSNERELERYWKEKREERIKQQLDIVRKQKTRELWESNMFRNNKNIIKGHDKIMTSDNMFMGKGNMLKGGLR